MVEDVNTKFRERFYWLGCVGQDVLSVPRLRSNRPEFKVEVVNGST